MRTSVSPRLLLIVLASMALAVAGCELFMETPKKPDPNKPSFGNTKVETQRYVAGVAIPHLVLPRATGGDGTLKYSLTPVPRGMSFDARARTLSGVPADPGRHELKYRVKDADGDVDELSFRIETEPLTTIYWPSYGGIHRTAIHGDGKIENVLTGGAVIIALALGQQHLYYVEGGEVPGGRIRRSNLDGSDAKTVVTFTTDYYLPFAIAVDSTNGKLYWGESESEYDEDSERSTLRFRIRRTNLDGSAEENVIHGDGSVASTAVDPARGKLYWSEGTLLDGKLRRANLDGSAPEDIVEGLVTGIRVVEDRLYYIEVVIVGEAVVDDPDSPTSPPAPSFSSKVWRANLDGSAPEIIVERPGALGLSLVVDKANKKLYWSEYSDPRLDMSSGIIRRANLDGSAGEVVVEGAGLVSGVNPENEKLYWIRFDSRTSGIRRADLDGSDAEDIVENRIRNVDVDGIALDVFREKIYWVESEQETDSPSTCNYNYLIIESDLDGANERVVIRRKNYPDHLELDVVDRKLYWHETIYEWTSLGDGGCQGSGVDGGSIRRANLDGSGDQKLVDLTEGRSGFEIDTVGRKLYWSDVVDRDSYVYGIHRSELDGTGQETVVGNLNGAAEGVAIDLVEKKLYWKRHDGVYRADLDGSGTVRVTRIVDQWWEQITVDGSTGKIYTLGQSESEGYAIGQTNLDGSGARVIVDELNYVGQFVLGVSPAPPASGSDVRGQQASGRNVVRPIGGTYPHFLQQSPFLR